MYDNFFTTYEITEPPPIRRRTYSRDIKNDIDKRNINLNDYPMVVTIDNPDLSGTPVELEAQNPFVFQTEQLPTIEKPAANTSPATKTSVNGKFSNKSNFTLTLISSYRRALLDNNMDPDWAPMLVASASIESAWGTKPSGSFNYGGVKVTDSLMRNGVSYTMRSTIDYVPGKGNIRREQPFRNFRSVDDYCNYMVRWLKSSKLYSSAFNKYSANQPMETWEYILRAGYGGGSDSNIRKYIRWMGSRYNQIKQA